MFSFDCRGLSRLDVEGNAIEVELKDISPGIPASFVLVRPTGAVIRTAAVAQPRTRGVWTYVIPYYDLAASTFELSWVETVGGVP